MNITKELAKKHIAYLEKCNTETDCPVITSHNSNVMSNLKRKIECVEGDYIEVFPKRNLLYVKLERDEIIISGAMHSLNNSGMVPITNNNGETVGSKPSDFSNERDFYNPIHMAENGRY